MQDNLAENTELETPELEQDVQQESEGPEYEINLGDSPSQDKPKSSPVVRRLVGQREKLREEVTEKDSVIQQLQAENEVLKKTHKAEPQFDDFDTDDEYRQAVREWAGSSQPKPSDPREIFSQYQQEQQKAESINNHYKRAEDLAAKFPDYSVAEEAAIQNLGSALVESITTVSDRSAEVLLYFGRNPEEAQRFKALASQNSIKATLELGRLETKLNIQARQKTPPPEPDEAIEGSGGNVSAKYEARLKKARENGDIKGAIAIRREAEKEGITL